MKPETFAAHSAERLLAAIGHTPLVEIPLVAEVNPGARLFAKLEAANPGGSIKDRPVARMLTRARAAGRFANGRRLLDSSSGNAGISYAMLGAALGVPVTLVVPGNASRERLDRIRAHGAELVITDPIEGYDFALREAHRLADEHPERYWYCDQYSNPDNWRAHYEDTAAEILEQVAAAVGQIPDAFVGGVGTGGTLTGVARRLREARTEVHVLAAIPETFPGIEGLKPLGQPGDIVPALLDESLIDERLPVTLDQAVAMCRRLTGLGLFVGPSSGAFVHAALTLARRRKHRTIVTMLNDTGERYVSTGMWEPATQR
ncbi:MAG: PLP-dependent cysteine synthase family protein [Betaproteobacteria bacterium]|nr:PLP-dependent cysteine synthase family protein [Betaproteobacteria bacterium]